MRRVDILNRISGSRNSVDKLLVWIPVVLVSEIGNQQVVFIVVGNGEVGQTALKRQCDCSNVFAGKLIEILEVGITGVYK